MAEIRTAHITVEFGPKTRPLLLWERDPEIEVDDDEKEVEYVRLYPGPPNPNAPYVGLVTAINGGLVEYGGSGKTAARLSRPKRATVIPKPWILSRQRFTSRFTGRTVDTSTSLLIPPKVATELSIPSIQAVGSRVTIPSLDVPVNPIGLPPPPSPTAEKKSNSFEDTMSFQNTDRVSIRYPKISGLEVAALGTFIDSEGKSFEPEFVYDMNSGDLKVNKVCFGLVRVSFSASYTVYKYTYKLQGHHFVPGLLIALNTETNDYATLHMGREFVADTEQIEEFVEEPKEDLFEVEEQNDEKAPLNVLDEEQFDDAEKVLVQRKVDAVNPHLVWEIDSDYGTKIAALGRPRLRLKLIPDVDADVETTGGEVIKLSSSTDKFEQVVEYLDFNGNATVNLKYQPHSGVNLTTLGKFISDFGASFIPHAAEPTEFVNEVAWRSASTYTRNGRRKLRLNEVGVVNGFNNLVPCYGVVKAEYTIKYDSYQVTFTERLDRDDLFAFVPITLIAFYKKQTASIKLTPPTRKGV